MKKLDEYVLNEVEYSEESPTGLIWKRDKFVGKGGNIHRNVKGSPAGSKKERGWTVMIDGVHYYNHRLIYEIQVGFNTESGIVDHVDGNPFNNLLSNLREVNTSVNSRNSKMSSLNTSGKTGVMDHVGKYWKVVWYENNKQKTKYFRYNLDNRDEVFKQASIFRDEIIVKLNSLGYGYTERHGL